MDFLHRTWAQIDLDNLKSNYRFIRSKTNRDSMIMAVVKADAYGHGALPVAHCLDSLGCDRFAVSNIEEAIQLRKGGIKKPILILGVTPANLAKELCEYDITQTVFSPEYARALSSQAQKCGVVVKAHIKLDSGMNRIGFDCDDEESLSFAAAACADARFEVEGVFTHFASADRDGDADGSFTKQQYEKFMRAIDRIERGGFRFKVRHCCNSAAILTSPEYHLDMVRAGIILYGLCPSSEIDITGLSPVMSLKSAVSMIKTVHSGESISYGRTFSPTEDIKVATIPVGYADGYIRTFAKCGRIIAGGKYAPLVGRICMDQCMADVSGIDIAEGDTVTLFGEQDGLNIPIGELAANAGTINYELVCIIGKRVARVYIENGKEKMATTLV